MKGTEMAKEIRFRTRLSPFKKGEKVCYMAVPVSNGVITAEQIYKDTAERIGLPPENVELAVRALFKAMENGVCDGKTINIENLLGARLSMSGTFDSADEAYDPAKHRINVNITAKGDLRTCGAELVGVNVTEGNRCRITSVLDAISKTEGVITAAQDVDVFAAGGTFLVDTTAEDEGCWLEDMDGTVVALGTVTASTATTLDVTFATTPDPGSYKFVVATRGGLGSQYGVSIARRNVTVVAPAEP